MRQSGPISYCGKFDHESISRGATMRCRTYVAAWVYNVPEVPMNAHAVLMFSRVMSLGTCTPPILFRCYWTTTN